MSPPPPAASIINRLTPQIVNCGHDLSAQTIPAYGRILGGGSQQSPPGGGVDANPDAQRVEILFHGFRGGWLREPPPTGMQQADNFQETKLKMHVAAGNAKLLLDHGDSKYADDVIRHWQIGLGSNAIALHFCTGATPTDLQ